MGSRALRAAIGAVLALGGCAPLGTGPPLPSQPIVPAPGPRSITTAEVAALADILRMEDSRDPDLEQLDPYISSPSSLVRSRAARALGAVRAAGAVVPLLTLLQDRDTSVAATAAFALGQLGDASAVSALAELLEPPGSPARVTVAAEAAYALGKIGAEPGRSALRRYLAGADPAMRAQSPIVRSALLAIWRFPLDAQDEPIARWTDHRDPEIRWRAAYALVRRRDPRAVSALQPLLRDDDARVRALAARGLRAGLVDSAGDARNRVLPALLDLLDDPAYIVRINTIGVLGTYSEPASIHALRGLLANGEPHERFAAGESLGRLGPDAGAASAAIAGLAADDRQPTALRRVALAALARIAPDPALRTASGLVESPEWRLRAAAAAVLASSEAPDAASAGGLLGDDDGRVAAAALQAVVLAAGDSLATLRPLLVESLRAEDVGVRVAALGALRQLADPGTLPAILDAYGRAIADPPNDAATAAVAALAALRSATLDPSRALFTRFGRPVDPLVHRLAVEHFGDAAVRAWGPAVPIRTGRSAADYEDIVRRRVVPSLQLRDTTTAVVETESGRITVRLLATDAPLTVESFAALAGSGYFDGQEWPRVVPDFVVQGGDPRGDMEGGPGYSIRDEISRHRYGTGTLGMALAGRDTGGSQFFITHSAQPHLDGIYAIFGETVDGLETTRRILPGETILSIRVSQR